MRHIFLPMADAIVKKHNKRPIVADIYTLGNMKILLDDLLNEYLGACGYRRDHTFPDARNAIGLISIALAMAVTYMSLNCKFDDVMVTISGCVLLYFVLNIAIFIVGYFEECKYRYGGFYLVTRVDMAPSYTIEYHLPAGSVLRKYTKSLYDLFDDTGKMGHALFVDDMEVFFNKE